MLEKYLGDSYDIIKRFWHEALEPIAPLYAHPKFIPAELQARFTTLTLIPILDLHPKTFGLLLDPHTGIPLPKEDEIRTSGDYASLPFIVETERELRPLYTVWFDQSYYRKHELDKKGQRAEKMKFLHKEGLSSFYYTPHAPFLFVTREPGVLKSIRDRLLALGIPVIRLEFETL